ncbi:hypothetical protein P3342_005636 [Pyrenophora teres f. teres]|uniref:Uncharacterized protein n=1 Tax=Pyrenophora teres f. teres TaxID=97479 RepID=A0A6S6VXT6_9PLEO|nr:hypothetical protein P3342_005636 [Pyrenophora teres f. teres]CAE7025673.1 hypothetical protein PTTW11_03951 [Pyrenophora teres f. teres]
MQYHLLNVLVVALPFLGFVSAWTNLVATCGIGSRLPGPGCRAEDAANCRNNPTIRGQCGGKGDLIAAWATGERCDCFLG